LQNISDVELIKRAKNRKNDPVAGAAAVGELYDRYYEAIFRYIWARVSNLQLAEDLTGDVFTRMVIHLPKYRYTGNPFSAWLYSIARHVVIDNYKKASSRNEVPLEDMVAVYAGGRDPAQIVEQQIFEERIVEGLSELNSFKRDVIILRFIVGLSLQEVASILERTISSIKVTQHRAIKELREILETHTGEEK
jgi:RNA polymerase sigma-70 factor (ECF subfamily)